MILGFFRTISSIIWLAIDQNQKFWVQMKAQNLVFHVRYFPIVLEQYIYILFNKEAPGQIVAGPLRTAAYTAAYTFCRFYAGFTSILQVVIKSAGFHHNGRFSYNVQVLQSECRFS